MFQTNRGSVNPAKPIVLSGSYTQAERHAKVTQLYKPIQASGVGEVMASHGMALASLSTGKARHADKVDFQRTLSRYRGPEISPGIYLDAIYDSRKMGRGQDCILLGIYRMICTNGLFVGSNFFKYSIRHSGDTYESLNEGIAAVLSYQEKLTQTIELMQKTELTPEQVEILAKEAAKLLVPSEAIEVKHRLLKANRESDNSRDLWTTFNLVQENSVKGSNVVYTLPATNKQGLPSVRNMVSRAIKPNSGKDADFNQALFDLALKFAS